MPIQRICKHSGAIIFDLTPDEQALKDTSDRLAEKERMLDEKLARLDEVLAKHDKK